MSTGLGDIADGYFDAKRAQSPAIPKRKGAAYIHGWLNGWADKSDHYHRGMTCAELQELADYCEKLDRLAGIGGDA